MSLLQCPKCGALYGGSVEACSKCKEKLEIVAMPGKKI